MRNLWHLIWAVFLSWAATDIFHPVPFSFEFFLAVGLITVFQLIQIHLFNKAWPLSEKVYISKLKIDEMTGVITFSRGIKDLTNKYPKKHLHEILVIELFRVEQGIAKYGSLDSNKDFDLSITIERDAEIIYSITAKNPKAKVVLCDISKSFDLIGII